MLNKSSISLHVGVLLGCPWLGACGDAVQAAEEAPNVVMIVLDTLRPDHMGCYGYERDTTPFLDSLAERSVLFTNAQSCAPWTAPSLATLMTSLYPEAHGVTGHPELTLLSERVVTLAEVLQEEGYATGAFTEGGYARGTYGLDQGFDVYPATASKTGSKRELTGRIVENVDRSIAWLAEREADRPFFLFFQTYETHTPLRVREEFVRPYRPDYDEDRDHAQIELAITRWNTEGAIDDADLTVMQRHFFHCKFAPAPPISEPQALFDLAEERGIPIHKKGAARFPEAVAWLRDFYDAAIVHADQELKRLFATLEAEGTLDNTVVVVVSDHGEGLGQRGRMGHGVVLHEELLRVVLFISVPPALGEPRRVNELVQTVDVMPTLLELVGAPRPDLDPQGRSLVEYFRPTEQPEEGRAAERPAFSQASRESPELHGVRTERWRLTIDFATGERKLFDLEVDPLEVTDVSEAHPDVADDLVSLIETARADQRARRESLDAGVESAVIDASALKDLEVLGYLGGDEDEE